MRQAFITALTELARGDKRIFVLTGDLGFSVFEKFREEFPDRFFNMGVAEANMVGIAAGLALSGKIVFIYSIVPFVTMRCFEQIRNDVCYQNLNVKIVGIGGGLCYGSAGMTHHSIEDIAIMRALPNMKVLAPADPVETALAIKAAIGVDGALYIRLGRGGESTVHSNPPVFKIGKAITVKDGTDVTLIATGSLVYNVLLVAKELSKEGISAKVISMHTVKPLDEEAILQAARETEAVFTIEEHTLVGGLGSAVAEVLAESSNRNIFFKRLGLRDLFCHHVGNQEYLREMVGLSVNEIIKSIRLNLLRLRGRAKESDWQ